MSTRHDKIFNLHVPETCPDVAPAVLNPENTWEDKTAYRKKARELAEMFHKNFRKFDSIAHEIANAGPAKQ